MNSPKLILPHSAQRPHPTEEVKQGTPDNKPRFNLPQEMKDEVRKFLPEAREIAQKVQELMAKGQAAQVALVCQEPIRSFLSDHIRSLLPQMVQTFAHTDRMQILSFFRQIGQQRLSPQNLATEKIDRATYEVAISDFMNLASRVPAQIFPIEIGLPDLDLESPEGETPTDTNQGDSTDVRHGSDGV